MTTFVGFEHFWALCVLRNGINFDRLWTFCIARILFQTHLHCIIKTIGAI